MESLKIQQQTLTYCPGLEDAAEMKPHSLAEVEGLLTEWFDREVILLASGRTALNLYLKAVGFNRYCHELVVPPYLSRCVLNAVTKTCFPIQIPQRGEAILLYHQFGFPQRYRPQHEIVIEDIAHNFFATPLTGRRSWQGRAAIFSLPKFFRLGGMAGGLVIDDVKLAQRVRELAEQDSAISDEDRAWMRNVIRRVYSGEGSKRDENWLDSAYELLVQLSWPGLEDLAGLPQSIEDISRIGQERMRRVEYLRATIGHEAWPKGFWHTDERLVPFAVPYFPRRVANLGKLSQAMDARGIPSNIYHVDIRRTMGRPLYRRCLLLPCHQLVPMSMLEDAGRVIERYDRA